MKVLVVGQGAREHAMVWKIGQSPHVTHIWAAPGNPGIALEPKTTNVDILASDIPALIAFASQEKIDLTLIGPELPLSLGIVDQFHEHGLCCLGPTQSAAALETSKAFAKNLMQHYHIPTAQYIELTQIEPAEAYLRKAAFPVVIKADGLAAGKGVVIAEHFDEAFDAVNSMLSGSRLGEAGKKIIIESFLEGRELSYIVLTDGKTIIPLASAQDHKRRNENDQGPNTGGMGAYSPVSLLTPDLEDRILNTIIIPTLKAMETEGCPYEGFLFAGLMITPEGLPKVLEFNCRLGDPETEVILMRLQSDFFELCYHAARQTLHQLNDNPLKWDSRSALCTILSAQSYPEKGISGEKIEGLPEVNQLPENCHIFHAGTQAVSQEIFAHGGRILCISALGETLSNARQAVHSIAEKIHWKSGVHYRRDIGFKETNHSF